MNKFFITGGAGFIGSHLVDRLIEEDAVVVYDNLSSGKKEFIAGHFRDKRFKFIEGDLLDINNLRKAKNYSPKQFPKHKGQLTHLDQKRSLLSLKYCCLKAYQHPNT